MKGLPHGSTATQTNGVKEAERCRVCLKDKALQRVAGKMECQQAHPLQVLPYPTPAPQAMDQGLSVYFLNCGLLRQQYLVALVLEMSSVIMIVVM